MLVLFREVPVLFPRILALTVVALLCFPASVTAQGAWQAVGQIGGPTQAIAIQGRYAYVGVGFRLVILDVSNSAAPVEVGVTPPFPDFVEDITVQGTLAYVAAGSGGLRVVDVSNPARPVETGAWESAGYAEGVALNGKTVYLAHGPYGLCVIDVSNPARPVQIGTAYSTTYAFKVAVEGKYAYLASAGAGLSIADVSDPRRPVEVGSLATTGFAYGVAIAGDTAYVADGWEGLKIVNVADRAHPRLSAVYTTLGWALGVTVDGSTAYVADATRGLQLVDVSDPARPVMKDSVEMPGGLASRVAVDDHAAYVADRTSGMRIVSVRLSAGPTEVGLYQPLAFADSVAVSGNFAYTAGAASGFAAVDVSDPIRPRQVASLRLPGSARDVAVSGAYAYVATMGPGTLQIIDVTDPSHPFPTGSCDFHGQGRGLDVAGNIVYIADEWGLRLINVADPRHPVELAFLRMQMQPGQPPTTVGVAVEGKRAYVVADNAGLIVVDVSDPAHPLRVADASAGGGAMDVAVAGNRVYVAGGGGAVHIMDVSDPAHPAVLGVVTTPTAEGVSLAGDLALVAAGDAGLIVADVSNPSGPAVVATVPTHGYARQVVAAANRAYVAAGLGGLVIADRTERGPGPSTVSTLAGSRPMVTAPAIPTPAATRVRSREVEIEAAGAGRVPARARACVVTSMADSGAGTLRECIAKGPARVTVTFDAGVFPAAAPATIRLAGPLEFPAWGHTTVDASNAGVILDGSVYWSRGGGAIALPSDGNTIRGLQIVGFPISHGISIAGNHNTIGGDRTRGSGPLGEGNLISGNADSGIEITGSYNVITGNLVGTDLSGTKSWGNGYNGIFVVGGANNRIGGPDPRYRNVFSGNVHNGITINGPGHDNLAIGNYVGTDVRGAFALGNHMNGITLELGAVHNELRSNLVSGNGGGIIVSDTGTNCNAILGNLVGTDGAGAAPIPNRIGIFAGFSQASFNRIGSLRPEERNLVSGNSANIMVAGGAGNLVLGNFIGTDMTGRRALPNSGGLQVKGSRRIFVEGNLIGGHDFSGIMAVSNSSYYGGNVIGSDAGGQIAMPNRAFGIHAAGRNNIFQGNVIANNGGGVWVDPSGSNTIRRNSIYGNLNKGIQDSTYGAAGFAPPVLTSVTATSVAGTACADCEVEIFSDNGGQGRIFEGSVRTDSSGNFSFGNSRAWTGPNLTATATDRRGNTSEFSALQIVPKQ